MLSLGTITHHEDEFIRVDGETGSHLYHKNSRQHAD